VTCPSLPLGASCASRVCFSVWGDTAALRLQWRPAPLAASGAFSLDQRLVGEPLALRAVHEAFQPLHRVTLHVTVIEPEGELVNVSAQVFLAGMVIDTDQAALENREHALNAVRMNIVTDVFAASVIDRLVI